MSAKFQPRAPSDIADLIGQQRFAWIVSRDGAELRATTLPLLTRCTEEGAVTHLIGHFPRTSLHVAALRQDPRCLMLTLGPHGYISPSWMRDRDWAPTWNFAHAQFSAELSFFEDPAEIEAHLRELVDTMERGRDAAWRTDEMGDRFKRLAGGVIGFTAQVASTQSRFKLGQDERPEILEDILNALGDTPLAALMREFNSGRA